MGKRKERDIRFYEALQSGNLDEVKDFIDHDGIDANEPINCCNISDLPLHFASLYGHLPIVQYLVEECKVDVEAVGIGFTAVYYACCLGHLDIVRYLAKKCHVNLEGGTNRCDADSVLVQTTSCRNAKLKIIRFLVQECHVNVNSVSDYNKNTALHFAVINYRLDITECLTLHGHADVEKKDIYGFTPFLRACNGSNFKAVKYLIQNCNANVDVKDNCGRTALHICCETSNANATEICQFLISECHANVETTDCKGRTPLHIACRHGKIDTVRYLIQDGHANVEATDNDGYNALCHIGKCDDLNTIRFLVQECYLNLFTHLSKEQTV